MKKIAFGVLYRVPPVYCTCQDVKIQAVCEGRMEDNVPVVVIRQLIIDASTAHFITSMGDVMHFLNKKVLDAYVKISDHKPSFSMPQNLN